MREMNRGLILSNLSREQTCPKCSEVLHCPVGAFKSHVRWCGQAESLFWAKVDKSAGTGKCWPWTASRTIWNYGHFHSATLGKRRNVSPEFMSHRLAWELAIGPIPAGMAVLHRCDNPPCCNVGHMFLGTNDDNVRDKLAKGRHPRGSACKGAKLDDESVREILARKPTGRVRGLATALAQKYGVREGQIYAVWRGTAWSHVAFPV